MTLPVGRPARCRSFTLTTNGPDAIRHHRAKKVERILRTSPAWEAGRPQSGPEPDAGWRTMSTTRSSLETGSPPSLFAVPATATSLVTVVRLPNRP